MSLSWVVVPVVPEIHSWLRDKGCEVPEGMSRRPTLDETLAVLNSLEGLPVTKRRHSLSSKIEAVLNRFKDQSVTKNSHSSDLWTLTVGTPHTAQYACLLGDVDPDGTYNFHFNGDWCREETMFEILKRLAPICGPLVICDEISAIPMVVSRDTDMDAALADWRERIRQSFAEADQRDQSGSA